MEQREKMGSLSESEFEEKLEQLEQIGELSAEVASDLIEQVFFMIEGVCMGGAS